MSKNYSNLDCALIAVQTGSPILLWGEPGIGKTEQIVAFANSLEKHIEVITASNRDPADFLGMPIVVDDQDKSKKVIYSPPEWALNLVKAKAGILFLDEFNTPPRAVQAALLRVVQDKVVGECVLPQSTWIMAAANPIELSAGGSILSAASANRFLHFDVEADLSSWRDWLIGVNRVNNVPRLPSNWEIHIPFYSGVVMAYSNSRPGCIQNCPKNMKDLKAWPSLRSWTMGIKVLAAAKSLGEDYDSGLTITLLSSAVGQPAALEFLSYIKNMDLPNPEDILSNPYSWDVNKRSDITYAILTSVVAAYAANITEDRWLRSWQVVDHVIKSGSVDVAIASAYSLVKLRKVEFKNPGIVLELVPALKAMAN